MTYQEQKGSINGKKVAWIGDGNNVCQTYMQAAEIFDFKLNIACPNGYEPNQSFIESYQNNINYCSNPLDACKNVDLVVTDVWTSMGKESEQKQRESAFKGYQVDQKMMSVANIDALFMHCLPAHRGEEVSADVIDGKQSVVWDEAENRCFCSDSLPILVQISVTTRSASLQASIGLLQ
jgi:ornithine carbamoyltransferase